MNRKPARLIPALFLAALPLTPLFADGGPHGRPFDGPFAGDGPESTKRAWSASPNIKPSA